MFFGALIVASFTPLTAHDVPIASGSASSSEARLWAAASASLVEHFAGSAADGAATEAGTTRAASTRTRSAHSCRSPAGWRGSLVWVVLGLVDGEGHSWVTCAVRGRILWTERGHVAAIDYATWRNASADARSPRQSAHVNGGSNNASSCASGAWKIVDHSSRSACAIGSVSQRGADCELGCEHGLACPWQTAGASAESDSCCHFSILASSGPGIPAVE